MIRSYPDALLEDTLDRYNKLLPSFGEDIMGTYNLGIILNIYANADIYKNHLTEKPFTGIFEFILFNKLMVPMNSGIATIVTESERTITLIISANTTKRDFLNEWTEIAFWQKRLSGYSKSKVHIKSKLDEDLKFLDIAAEKELDIKKSGKKGKEAAIMRSGAIYKSMDEIYGEEQDFFTGVKDSTKLSRRRQKIYRVKKIIGTK
jgi:hypothetical protein